MKLPNLDFLKRLLQRFRERLTNYTRKNQELYFKESARSLNLTKHPFPALRSEDEDNPFNKFDGITSNSSSLFTLVEQGRLDLNDQLLLNITPDETLAPLFDEQRVKLEKKLDKIKQDDTRFQREYGISGAWLLGPFLCWRASRDYSLPDIVVSPILRIPIDIKTNKKRDWTLVLEDQELSLNPSLRLFLKHSWGIELPERFEDETVEAAVNSFVEIVSKGGKKVERAQVDEVPRILPRTRPERDEDGEVIGRRPVEVEKELRAEELEIYRATTSDVFQIVDVFDVSQINASKMVLVEDYDKIIENVGEHPIISELLLSQPVKEDSESRSTARELDQYKESTNHFVVEIDSTQHTAVDSACKRRAIAIQGPPGTGKSQTITNLIADKITSGEKVLFVSEKRAALDVVFTRLKKAEIADQAVLIHSSDLHKQELYQSFLDLADAIPRSGVNQEWDRLCSELDTTKRTICNYREALAQRQEQSGLTFSEIFTRRANVPDDSPNLAMFNYIGEVSFETLNSLAEELNDLQDLISKVSSYEKHPWLHRKPNVVNTATFKAEFSDINSNVSAVCREIEEALERLERTLPTFNRNNVGVLEKEYDELSSLKSLSSTLQPVSVALAKRFEERVVLQQQVSQMLGEITSKADSYDSFQPDVRVELIRKLDEYWQEERGFLDWFSAEFWRKRKLKKRVLLKSAPVDDTKIFKEYLDYIEAHEELSKLLTELGFISIPSAADRKGIEQCVKETSEILSALVKFEEVVKVISATNLKFPFAAYSALSDCIDTLSSVRDVALEYSRALTTLANLKGFVQAFLDRELDWSEDLAESKLLTQELWEKIPDLDLLDAIDGRLSGIEQRFSLTALKDFIVEHLISRNGTWGEYIYNQYIIKWCDEAKTSSQVIRLYDSHDFEKTLYKFRELENRHREVSREFVTNKWAHTTNGSIDSLGLRLLKKEAGKKRRVLTPREIMEKGALEAMLLLKPCWLMSPLSISQLLPLQLGLFDTIIFDEASQVRIEDAIPSIFRAEKLVVVGDQQQMPPTNFFSVAQDDDDEDEEFEEIPESILDLALQVYPDILLEWHYRSKAEALIAFSNRAFYGGRLVACPNPQLLTDGDAIEFHQIDNAYFNQKNGNRVEAEVVVSRVKELLEEDIARSVGVMALGQAQMKVIQSVLDERMDADPAFRRLIENASNLKDGEANIGFFVKNLENVQGDERDVILISVGYAPSRPGKKLYKNFGPLSKSGGGRRLNVAVTRAKERVIVVTSFNPDEVPTDEEAFHRNPDVTYFGRYLKYARAVARDNLEEARSILDSFPMGGVATTRKPTRFNLDVKRRLEERGYAVSTEIGTCGYFIDLGVHHPVDDRKFVLGIECDGATFHSTQYARDRDKIREQLLRSRGWKIERIGSIEWSKDWEGEIARIEQRLSELLPDNGKEAQPVHIH